MMLDKSSPKIEKKLRNHVSQKLCLLMFTCPSILLNFDFTNVAILVQTFILSFKNNFLILDLYVHCAARRIRPPTGWRTTSAAATTTLRRRRTSSWPKSNRTTTWIWAAAVVAAIPITVPLAQCLPCRLAAVAEGLLSPVSCPLWRCHQAHLPRYRPSWKSQQNKLSTVI